MGWWDKVTQIWQGDDEDDTAAAGAERAPENPPGQRGVFTVFDVLRGWFGCLVEQHRFEAPGKHLRYPSGVRRHDRHPPPQAESRPPRTTSPR